MKPKTQEQKRVIALFDKMQKKWKHLMPKKAFKNLNEGIIGQTLFENRKMFRCQCLYCVSQKVEDYQVFRFFWIVKFNYKRKVANPKKDYYEEIYTLFYNLTNRKVTLVAPKLDGLSTYTSCRPVFSRYSDFEVRPHKFNCDYGYYYRTPYYFLETYDTYFVSRHKDFTLDKVTERMFADGYAPLDILNKLDRPHCSQYETMYKRGEYALAGYIFDYGEFEKETWKSLLCALRHGRTFNRHQDVTDFKDLVSILSELHLDTHSPKYLRIKADSIEHNDLLTRLHNQREREHAIAEYKREVEKLASLTKEKEEYVRRIAPFSTLAIKVNENITARILPNVDEFFKEGNAMHHCVFTCEYYKSEKSVVLSARDNFGNRVETVEVDVKRGEVLQSRGKYNKRTEYHDEIVKMVNLMFLQEMKKARSRYNLDKVYAEVAERELCYECE